FTLQPGPEWSNLRLISTHNAMVRPATELAANAKLDLLKERSMPKFKALTFALCIMAIACTLLAVRAVAQSQASTGEIAGTIKDPAGAVIPNANVEAISMSTGLRQTAKTNSDGFFSIVLLPPARYKVTVTA